MAYTDVNYEKVSWLNTPSTNTPINATNLGKMDDGIEACASRANASVPFDNILSLAEAQSVTVRNTYVLDAVDSAKTVSRIGTNTITYENGEYYIKADSGVKKKLLNKGIILLGNVSYTSYTLSVHESIKTLINKSNIYIKPIKMLLYGDGKFDMLLTPKVLYDQPTGIITVNGLIAYSNNDFNWLEVEDAYVYAYV